VVNIISLYSAVNSVQSDGKMFNYGKCSQEMPRLCFSTKINLHYVFKMSAFGKNAVF